MSEKLRLDKYLWAIRIFKTRTQAANAITNGKVKLNGEDVKPSKHVGVGDRYDIKTEEKKWVIEVTGLLEKRVQYSEAINYYLDLTPVEEINKQKSSFVEYTGKRQSKQGRPTKRNRRELDELLG
ncbi:MAG: ribosome-associated heat shock protein implicated in the recycling of the subunit [Bacteroidota bacterium]|nr:ribosome-associated heat shock protein implicated in the recycling of the subunit [Bacteroidota bacterium]